MSFDALNVISKSEKLYHELDEMNKEAFLEIAKQSYRLVNPNTDGNINMAWLLALLVRYDPITKYVYTHEVDRKRSRFAESVIASNTKSKEFTTAENLWYRQTKQYADNTTDEARVQAYKDQGVKVLYWHTNMDGKECKVCRDRNGKAYPINKLAVKPHQNCRCWYSDKRGDG